MRAYTSVIKGQTTYPAPDGCVRVARCWVSFYDIDYLAEFEFRRNEIVLNYTPSDKFEGILKIQYFKSKKGTYSNKRGKK